ncbi:DUF2637 domain-containing protein [Streptomyces sp. NPDC086023]|uniref:DUF2637 domain-containing protein n=1 Tax=Streptomyces sp. NPDC086023 TaxID=3365746 RepID=UPI0037D67AC0
MSATGKPLGRGGRNLLVGALVVVVLMAFRVSWNALRDVARTIGADDTAAMLYPFVVDGLMALALVAALVLTGDGRRFALRVLAAYTAASLVLNYVHGLHGTSGEWARLAESDALNWALVLLAASLPVGSIYFGSDLVGKVLHHRPPTGSDVEESTQDPANQSMSDLPESAPAGPAPAPEPALPELGDDEVFVMDGGVPVAVMKSDRVAAADRPRPRRATGRVPESARTTRTVRTADELLAEARALTESWSVKELTADRLRQTLRTSPANGRMLRDTLRAERERNAAAEAVAVS